MAWAWSSGYQQQRLYRRPAYLARQHGITLLLVLLLMIVVVMIGTSAAQLALQGEKAARAERDRHVAFQAAEDALADAERDIQGSAGFGASGAGADGGAAASSAALARSAMFAADAGSGFSDSCGAVGAGGAGTGSA